jgi:hypothetical protein
MIVVMVEVWLGNLYGNNKGNQNNAVDIVTDSRMDGRGVGLQITVGEEFLSPPPHIIQTYFRSRWLFARGGKPVRAWSSPPTSAQVKNTWSSTSSTPYAFIQFQKRFLVFRVPDDRQSPEPQLRINEIF